MYVALQELDMHVSLLCWLHYQTVPECHFYTSSQKVLIHFALHNISITFLSLYLKVSPTPAKLEQCNGSVKRKAECFYLAQFWRKLDFCFQPGISEGIPRITSIVIPFKSIMISGFLLRFYMT